jgi:hypothetical protein
MTISFTRRILLYGVIHGFGSTPSTSLLQVYIKENKKFWEEQIAYFHFTII